MANHNLSCANEGGARRRMEPEEELLPGEIQVADAVTESGLTEGRIHQLIRAKILRARIVKLTGARFGYAINGESFRQWMRTRPPKSAESVANDRPGRTIRRRTRSTPIFTRAPQTAQPL